MAYPATPVTFPTRLDGQVIFAAHMNAVQAEVSAIEQGLLNGFAHLLKPLTDDAYDLGSASKQWKDLWLGGDAHIAGNLTVGGTVTFPAGVVAWADIDFTGSDLADLETRSASDLSSGTLPDARFPATLPAISGVNLTNLNATNLASGTVADARLSANVPLLDAANQFSNTNRFTNTGLTILDTDASHVLTIKPGSNITGNKTLTLTTGDADRTVTLNGNPTLDDWFDQAVKVASSPTFNALTLNGLLTHAWTDAGTSDIVTIRTTDRNSSGTSAVGFGVKDIIKLDLSNVQTTIWEQETAWASLTAAAESVSLTTRQYILGSLRTSLDLASSGFPTFRRYLSGTFNSGQAAGVFLTKKGTSTVSDGAGPKLLFKTDDNSGSEVFLGGLSYLADFSNSRSDISFIVKAGSGDTFATTEAFRIGWDLSTKTFGWAKHEEVTSNPTTTDISSLNRMAIYMKADKFVIAYNNGGTMTYISIPMDGSTTTWTHSTSAP